jgi:predicted Zn-ribbon and HTH transcriptional regulator
MTLKEQIDYLRDEAYRMLDQAKQLEDEWRKNGDQCSTGKDESKTHRSCNCRKCGHGIDYEPHSRPDVCPKCGSDDLTRGILYITCCCMEMCCDGFTNTCEVCRADYNGSGHLLAPRCQWGEETGECAADILNNRDCDETHHFKCEG